MALKRVLLPLFGCPRKMTVGDSTFIGNNVHHNLVGDALAQGYSGVRSQVMDQKRAPEYPLGIDLDQVVLVETQGE